MAKLYRVLNIMSAIRLIGLEKKQLETTDY